MTSAPTPTPPPAPDQARWPYALAAGFLALGLVVLLLWPVRLPFFAMSPGPIEAVADIVAVEDGVAVYDSAGEIYLLTVSITSQEVNAFEWVEAQLDEKVDLIERERIRPSGVSREEVTRSNLEAMDGSIEAAIFVALGRLGYEVGFAGEGVEVIQVVEGAPADGAIELGDRFTVVAGQEITTSDQAAEIIRSYEIGDTITLEGFRLDDPATIHDEDPARSPVTVEITLAPHPDIEGAPMVGVVFDTIALEMILPVDIDIESGNIGGPSAGLAFTLSLIDLLSSEDLTRGHVIAATGTIRFDESVGAIGGVRQKVYAARAAGVDAVFVPTDNYEDALTAAGDDIAIVSIGTLQDALDYLDSLPVLDSVTASG
jgi:PDZ domain-containing protein